MIRGTTPTLYFTLPLDVELLEEVWITLAQNGEVKLNKRLSDCQANKNVLSTKLTQEETLSLTESMTEIQIRVKTKSGEAMASQIILETTKRILKDGVI